MAKKDDIHHGVSFIPSIGEKQGSWYFPLFLIFATICAAAIVLLISAVIDLLQLSTGLTVLLVLVMIVVLVFYIIAAILIFIEWTKNTKAITDQEVAKSQILFLESYKKAIELKPGQALYDAREWLHDLTAALRTNRPEQKQKKK